MKKQKHFLTIALMGLLLPGCMAAAKQETASFDALSERYASDAEALAVSAAREISDRHTSYVPISVDAAPGAFGTALERELRNNGMTLVDSGGVRLSYKLNVTQQDGKPLGYAEISSSDGKLLCFTRNLGEMRYTAAPSGGASSSSLVESRPLPDPAVSTAEAGRLSSSPIIGGGTPVEPEKRDVAPREPVAVAAENSVKAKTVTVTKPGTAAAVARRYGVPVRDFCRWNNVGAGAMLIEGYQVYLSEPPAGTIPVAAENPVPAGVAAGTPEATLPAPVPASTTLPAHTSAKLSLPSAAPQKTETISYTPVAAPTPPAPLAPVAKGPGGVSPVPSPMSSTPSGDTAAAVPASLPADAEIVPISNPAGMGVRSWKIVKGEMLKAQLERWASDAGYTLIWSAHNDYEMQSDSTFTGPFKDAVKAFFGALQSNGHALRVTIFEGNNVMEVSEH